MRREDIMVEVRDRNLLRKGQITTRYLRLVATLRDNKTGDWKLTLPGAHPMVPYLSADGAGIVVSYRSNPALGVWSTLFSGMTVLPSRSRNREQPDGTFVFEGKTDGQLLDDARAYPQPSNANVGTQTETNDTRSGAAETVMRAYVNANIGPTAPAGRKGGFRSLVRLDAPDLGRGGTVTKSPRFQILSELLSEIGTLSGLSFQLVQRASLLQFEITPTVDRSAFVRFDIANGTLTSEQVQVTPPSLTRAIVAGQGEGTARTIIQRTSSDSTAAESSWGRIIERFIDQRDTDDLVELEQSGDEALIEEGSVATNVKVVPADDTTMLFVRDWNVGDLVTVVVNGQETKTTVTEAVLIVDEQRAVVGAAIGDVRGFDPADALTKRVEDTERAVESLQRSVEIDDTPLTLDRIAWTGNLTTEDLDALLTPALYETASVVSGTLARHYPVNGWAGIIEVYTHGGHTFQRATSRGDGALAGRVFMRSKFSTVAWTPWRELNAGALPDPQQIVTGATHSITATSWAQVPGVSQISLVLARPAWVTVTLGAWMTAAAGDTRASVQCSGATTIGAIDAAAGDATAPWGQTLYKATGGTGTEQHTLTRNWKLNAGTTTIAAVAYQSGGGAHAVNYPVLEVMPVRWADLI